MTKPAPDDAFETKKKPREAEISPEPQKPILEARNLSVAFGAKRVVEDLSFEAWAGRTLAVVGESGSGKSMTALSILRLADLNGARYPSGEILFRGAGGERDLLKASQREMRRIRGREIAMIFQEPMTSLNPLFPIGDQIGEVLRLHEKMSRADSLKEAARLLRLVRLPDPEAQVKRYPHHLSGGMRQRAMIAMALACRPKLLIADEPTTALDVTIQAQILAILRDLQAELGMGLIFITHDMGVVAEMADEVVVMKEGRKLEGAAVRPLFAAPRHPYTQALLAAAPRLGAMEGRDPPPLAAAPAEAPLLSVRDLSVRFDVRRDLLGRPTHRVNAVTKASFDLQAGETLALVGESGSGKSTIGRAVQQLLEPSGGEILFKGRALSAMSPEERRRLRQKIQYVFQDPYASLDPRKRVGWSVAEPIRTHGLLPEAEIPARVAALFARVGLTAEQARRYPHEFSGGQRQRVCIARALASDPEILIADEALSALDVSIQAQVLELFQDLQRERGLAYLFISHDMAVVEKISHRVAVLRMGQIVETGGRRQVFESPAHSYTRKLLAAAPAPDPLRRRPAPLMEGEPPGVLRRVGEEPAPLPRREVAPGHLAALEV